MSKGKSLTICICLVLHTVSLVTGNITLNFTISEELPDYTVVGNIPKEAGLDTQYSQDVLSTFNYHFLQQPKKPHFAIERTTGILVTKGVLDRDTLCLREETCRIRVGVAISPKRYFQVIEVFVNVMDMNDHAPVFPEENVEVSLAESSPLGTEIQLPAARDTDTPQNSVTRYELKSPSREFHLSSKRLGDGTLGGVLTLEVKLDREKRDVYHLILLAKDGGDPQKTGTAFVTVKVTDSNDNMPEFANETEELTVPENLPVGSTIYLASATDEDIGENGKIGYAFSMKTNLLYGDIFSINNFTGEIVTLKQLDKEVKDLYKLVIKATDNGPDSYPAYMTLQVNILDLNDNKPSVNIDTLNKNQSYAVIGENKPVGTVVAFVIVTDKDLGKNGEIKCYLEGKGFSLENVSLTEFKILSSVVFDREEVTFTRVGIKCSDKGSPPLETTRTLNVSVIDTNDNPPMFIQRLLQIHVDENNPVGRYIGHVTATDRDVGKNAEIQYSIAPSSEDFVSIDSQSGAVRATSVFDYEQNKQIVIPIVAEDKGDPPLSSTATLVIHVTDINDNIPTFKSSNYSFAVFENSRRGTLVGSVAALDADFHPYNRLIYLLPRNICCFKIHPSSGQIQTKLALDRETRSVYIFTVTAVNTEPPRHSSSATVTVHVADRNDNSPVFIYPSYKNNSLFIPDSVEAGQSVTQVSAYDLDLNENSEISFEVIRRIHGEPFQINASTGIITVQRGFRNYRYYKLIIKASDKGQKSLHALTELHITLNKTNTQVLYPPGLLPELTTISEGASVEDIGNKYTLIIAIGAGSILLMIILAAVIVILKCQDHRKYRKRRGNVQENSNKSGRQERTAKNRVVQFIIWCRGCVGKKRGTGVLDVEQNVQNEMRGVGGDAWVTLTGREPEQLTLLTDQEGSRRNSPPHPLQSLVRFEK